MARIRTIKPELPHDAGLARVSREARYTFLLLLTQADDQGFFRACPRTLVGELYPHDEDVSEVIVVGWLDALLRNGQLRCWGTTDGLVGEIVNFTKHQRVDHPSRSFLASLSREPRESFAKGVSSPESRVLNLESRVSLSGETRSPGEPEHAGEGAETNPSRSGRKKSSSPNWLAPFWDAWRAQYGGDPTAGVLAKALDPLKAEHGADAVLANWRQYLAKTPAQYASAQKFAQTYGSWGPEVDPAIARALRESAQASGPPA